MTAIENKTLPKTWFTLLFTDIVFFLLNFFHIALASTLTIELSEVGLLRYQISFFTSFNYSSFFIALIVVVVQFILSYILLIQRFRKRGITEIKPIELEANNQPSFIQNLRISPQKIYNWVQELAAEHNVKSIKRVYLTDMQIPSVMTIDIIPLPFIRHSWLVLDANIIEILEEREIKAIICHELGHVKYGDGTVNFFKFGLNYFVFIAYAFPILELFYLLFTAPVNALSIALRIAFIIIVVFILLAFTILSNFLMNISRRQAEFICDVYSAKHVGRNHMINALLTVGKRNEVLNSFYNEFRWLGSLENKENISQEFIQGLKELSPQELSRTISREKAVSIYIRQRLQNLKTFLKIPLKDKQIEELADKASKELIMKRKNGLNNNYFHNNHEKKEHLLIQEHDLLLGEDNSLFLDNNNLDKLIKIIESNPEKSLFSFDSEKENGSKETPYPTIKERILFLYYNLEKNRKKESSNH
ncbi:hypothetical protein EU523_01845 [Candidatus Heimdallarchaeota archaeon]|nr:MAG: hypothetical protein EU523_01845 [Candidatus Heimdallarchaeota archaeon]